MQVQLKTSLFAFAWLEIAVLLSKCFKVINVFTKKRSPSIVFNYRLIGHLLPSEGSRSGKCFLGTDNNKKS